MRAKVKNYCMLVLVLAGSASFAAIASSSGILTPGKKAPPETVRQLQDVQPVTIGSAVVRPVATPTDASTAYTPQAAAGPARRESTLVVRASDNLVGVSDNDLVVLHVDTAAVTQAATGKASTIKPYPDLGLVVLHFSRFDELVEARKALAELLPAARFDLPVRYFKTLPR